MGWLRIIARFLAALAGRREWLRIRRRFNVDNGLYVLLMPESDIELNRQALRHIDDLLAARCGGGVVVVTGDAWVLERAPGFSRNILAVVEADAGVMERMMIYYEFYKFSERLLIISLDRPYGNRVRLALGRRGITVEDVVCLGLLGIREWSGA